MRHSSLSLSGVLLVSALFLVSCGTTEPVSQEQGTIFNVTSLEQANRLATSAAMEAGIASTGVASASGTWIPRPYLATTEGSGTALPGEETAVVLDLSQVATYNAIRTATASLPQGQYVVVQEFVNVRGTPSSRGQFIAKILKGDMVTLTSFADADWAFIKLKDGKVGYVITASIARMVGDADLGAELKAYEGQYFVSYQYVNMRKEATKTSEKVGQIPGRAIIKPEAIANGWAKVTYNGVTGYVSTGYITPFKPPLLVRQSSFVVPILHYRMGQAAGSGTDLLAAMREHVAKLKADGYRFLTFRDLRDLFVLQESKDARIEGKVAVLAFTGLAAGNVLAVSDALNAAGVDATLFLASDSVGIRGITERTLSRLLANGFDIQSAGITGQDLRSLTDTQVRFELSQSRKTLEDMLQKPIFAVSFVQGGGNERLAKIASEVGYLLGLSSASGRSFSRSELFNLPSIPVYTSMTADDVLKLVQGR